MRIAAPLDRCLAEMGDFVFEALLEDLLAGNFGDELFARQCAIDWVARQRAVGCNGGKVCPQWRPVEVAGEEFPAGEGKPLRPRIAHRRQNIGHDRAALRDAPKRHPVSSLLTHRSEEHTSELQSLMRISYAVFCLKK